MNNFIQKYYFFSAILLISISTLSMDRILSLGTPTKSDISNAIVYCGVIDALKKESVLENIKKPVDIIKHDYCLTTLPLELRYKIFNQLPSDDKNVLMQTCFDFYRLGNISSENLRFFVFDPTLICSSKDLGRLAQVEFATDDYHCNSDMIVHMNQKYAAQRQLHLIDRFQQEYKEVDNGINKGLSLFNLLKNCYRWKDHCTFLEIKARGNFTDAIYNQCRLEAAMNHITRKLVQAERDKSRSIISLKHIKNHVVIKFFQLGLFSGASVASIYLGLIFGEIIASTIK